MSTSTMNSGAPVITIDQSAPRVPMSRLVRVELRKMFDTRSGFWLMVSMAILAVVATIAVIIFADENNLDYGSFSTAIGVPMAVLLPIMAILAVTSEWSQRTGLTTFTLVPDRGRVIGAKGITAILVGIVSMVIAMAIGAIGNLIGPVIRGVDITWGVSIGQVFTIILANVLGLLIGFMLGVLIRNSPGAIVAYFVYSFVVPTIFGALAASQGWFENLQPWVDFNFSQTQLFDSPTGHDWATLAVSSVIWLIIPLAIGVRSVMRSEVK
ncbi:MAG: ABC transporter permease [Tomitella sp.]|nr:ABC transporter permease [Tomitella sp.]